MSAFAERLACEKAQAIAQQQSADAVLGADTIVVVDGHILGKPVDARDAARMLRMLAAKTHEVITAVCLIPQSQQPTGAVHDVRSETTQVTFAYLTDADIDYYVSTGEPMDKAGAYGIQGIASRWISRIVGDYPNVVGLPIALVYRMLIEHGLLRSSPVQGE